MNLPEGCTAIEIGELLPLKGEPSTDLKLPEEVSTRYAAMALACGTARKALRPEEPPLLLPLPPQLASEASAQARARMIPSKPTRLFSVIKSFPQLRGHATITTDFVWVPCAPSDESCPSGTPDRSKTVGCSAYP